MYRSNAHVFCLTALAASTLGSLVAPSATIDAGVVYGVSTSLPAGSGPVNKFLGIPFAQSPPERFSPPSDVQKFSKALNATEFKSACIQQFECKLSIMTLPGERSLNDADPLASSLLTQKLFNNPPAPESEDCLYLNVYAPSGPLSGEGKAVLFWIYGGSLKFGHAGAY
jgi:carboxylesterase type B